MKCRRFRFKSRLRKIDSLLKWFYIKFFCTALKPKTKWFLFHSINCFGPRLAYDSELKALRILFLEIKFLLLQSKVNTYLLIKTSYAVLAIGRWLIMKMVCVRLLESPTTSTLYLNYRKKYCPNCRWTTRNNFFNGFIEKSF